MSLPLVMKLLHIFAVFWFLGVGNAAKGWEWASHHPRFMLDEDAMEQGVAVLAGACLRALSAG